MEIRAWMSKLGKKGGPKGGKRRAQTTTPEQRKAWGRKGGKLAGRGRPKKAAGKKKDT